METKNRKSVQVLVRMSKQEHQLLLTLANKIGESASSIIRQQIRKLAKKEL